MMHNSVAVLRLIVGWCYRIRPLVDTTKILFFLSASVGWDSENGSLCNYSIVKGLMPIKSKIKFFHKKFNIPEIQLAYRGSIAKEDGHFIDLEL